MWVTTAAQITPYAVAKGFVPVYMLVVYEHPVALAAMLHDAETAQGYADAYLDYMERERGIHGTLHLAYAWNAGPGSKFGSKPDALAFAHEVYAMLYPWTVPPPAARAKQLTAGN